MRVDRDTAGRTARQIVLLAVLRWSGLTLLGLGGLAALVYMGDFATYVVRGRPQDQVAVTRYMAAELKGNKSELFYEGSGPMPCAKALFPQGSLEPCWYLRRHPLDWEPD
jgi:hypothetical protein